MNDLLDEEQSDRRRVLRPGFAQHFSMPNDASSPDYGLFGEPYLMDQDQSEPYLEGEPPRFYSTLSTAPRGLRDRSYSQFDLPSYSSSGQFDDLMMNQWPYNHTEFSMPSFFVRHKWLPLSVAGFLEFGKWSKQIPILSPCQWALRILMIALVIMCGRVHAVCF